MMHIDPPLLEGFYAVTTGPESRSVYEVIFDPIGVRAFVKKVKLLGRSYAPVGYWCKGERVLIGHSLRTFNLPEDEPTLDKSFLPADDRKLGSFYLSWSNNIVGLFRDGQTALTCFESSTRLKPYDLRFVKETEEVIVAIGAKHPAFFFPKENTWWPASITSALLGLQGPS